MKEKLFFFLFLLKPMISKKEEEEYEKIHNNKTRVYEISSTNLPTESIFLLDLRPAVLFLLRRMYSFSR